MTDDNTSYIVGLMEKKFYSVRELAVALGISRQACYARVKRGQIRTVAFGDRGHLVPALEFEKWTKVFKMGMHHKTVKRLLKG